MNPSPHRWIMISFAFCATVINYLDRQTLSVSAPVLRDRFHMSNMEYSYVLFAFLLAYTIMNGVSGTLIDRIGTRVGYAACVAWWSAAAVLHALVRGPLSLGFFRFLLGMGEAGNWPAGVKVVAEWFPERERALASGVFNSGSAVGAILAPPIIAFILLKLGWRAAFAFVGAIGFVWLLLWLPSYREPSGVIEANSVATPAWRLIRTRFVASFTLSKVFMDPAWYFYVFWFPEYLKRVRNFDMVAIGKCAWIPFAVAGFGNLLGGLLSGFLLHCGFSLTNARKASVTFFTVLMTSAIPAVIVHDARLSIALVSLAMLGYTGSLANMLAMPSDVFSKSAAASVYGLASMGSGFGGMLFTFMTGWAIDHYSYRPVFFGFGIMPMICTLILWTTLGPLCATARTTDSAAL